MVEKKKPIFLKVMLLVILFLVLEAAAFIYVYLPAGFVGFAISDVSEIYMKLSFNSKLFLVVQWIIIVLLLILVYVKNHKIRKRNSEVSGIDLNSAIRSSKTNLDALYIILKKKGQLTLKTIAEVFKIKEDLAIEWSRILEAGDLVVIDYPGLGSPIVRIKEKVDGEEKKNDLPKVKVSKKVRAKVIKEESVVKRRFFGKKAKSGKTKKLKKSKPSKRKGLKKKQ